MPERLGWVGMTLERELGPVSCNSILEVGVYITEAVEPFEVLGAAGYALTPTYPLDDLLMEPSDVERHEASGLLPQLRAGIHYDKDQAQEEIIELMYRFGEPGHFTLAGRRPVSRLRVWMKWWLPDLYQMFSPDLLDLDGFSQVLKYSDVRHDYEHSEEFKIPDRAIHEAEFYYREFLHYQEMLLQHAKD